MSNKKVVCFLGSPRTNGNSEILAHALAKGAQQAGHSVSSLNCAKLDLNGCLDCRGCWKKNTPCVQSDDMALVYEKLEWADIFVFATPLYFFTWSTQIKPIWDRMLPYFGAEPLKRLVDKKAILLATAGDTEPSCFDGLKATFRHSCGYAGWPILGEICATGVYGKGDIVTSSDWIQLAENLGRNL